MSVTTPHPKRWAILGFMCLALVVTGLDSLIVAVAIPSIEVGLQVTGEQLQWIVAAYSFAFAAPLLFFGGLADRVRDSHPITIEVLDRALIADSFIYRLCYRRSCL